MGLKRKMQKVKVKGSYGKEYLRQPCNIRQRTMGYYAPINRVNIGKKSEFYSRKYFKEGFLSPRNFDKINSIKQDNRNFIEKYS